MGGGGDDQFDENHSWSIYGVCKLMDKHDDKCISNSILYMLYDIFLLKIDAKKCTLKCLFWVDITLTTVHVTL